MTSTSGLHEKTCDGNLQIGMLKLKISHISLQEPTTNASVIDEVKMYSYLSNAFVARGGFSKQHVWPVVNQITRLIMQREL